MRAKQQYLLVLQAVLLLTAASAAVLPARATGVYDHDPMSITITPSRSALRHLRRHYRIARHSRHCRSRGQNVYRTYIIKTEDCTDNLNEVKLGEAFTVTVTIKPPLGIPEGDHGAMQLRVYNQSDHDQGGRRKITLKRVTNGVSITPSSSQPINGSSYQIVFRVKITTLDNGDDYEKFYLVASHIDEVRGTPKEEQDCFQTVTVYK